MASVSGLCQDVLFSQAPSYRRLRCMDEARLSGCPGPRAVPLPPALAG